MRGLKETALVTTGQRCWAAFLCSALLGNVEQKQLIAMALLLKCVFLCVFSEIGRVLVICAPSAFYRTGISMQDHLQRLRPANYRPVNYIHRWRTGNIFKVSDGNTQKSLLIVTFVLTAPVRQCGGFKIHSGRRKIPQPKFTKRDYDLTIREKRWLRLTVYHLFLQKNNKIQSFFSRSPTYSIFYEKQTLETIHLWLR